MCWLRLNCIFILNFQNPTDVASFEPSSPATVQLCSSRPSTPGSDLDSCEEQGNLQLLSANGVHYVKYLFHLVITNKSSVRPPPSPISLTEASCTVGMQGTTKPAIIIELNFNCQHFSQLLRAGPQLQKRPSR